MPSLDFVRDICDTLKKQRIDYYIISIQVGSKVEKYRTDIFASITDEKSLDAIENHIDELKKSISTARAKFPTSKKKTVKKKTTPKRKGKNGDNEK